VIAPFRAPMNIVEFLPQPSAQDPVETGS
jgi:hypothetical protein